MQIIIITVNRLREQVNLLSRLLTTRTMKSSSTPSSTVLTQKSKTGSEPLQMLFIMAMSSHHNRLSTLHQMEIMKEVS